MVEGGAEQGLLDAVLALARDRGLLSGGGRQRTDSTHVLAAVRALNRLECVIETMRHALESLAVAAPDWLRAHAQPDWAGRYGHRAMDDRLAKNAARREERARTVGGDGHALLAAALDPAAPGWLRQVPAVETLRRVWVQHTIRTQSTIRPRRVLAPRRRAAQRDDMADLQAVLVDDDALDDELQDCLLLGERGFVQPAAHASAERGQVEQDLLGRGALAA